MKNSIFIKRMMHVFIRFFIEIPCRVEFFDWDAIKYFLIHLLNVFWWLISIITFPVSIPLFAIFCRKEIDEELKIRKVI